MVRIEEVQELEDVDLAQVEEPTPWSTEIDEEDKDEEDEEAPPLPAPIFPPPPPPPVRRTMGRSRTRSPRREEPPVWSKIENYPRGYQWLDVEVPYGKRYFTIIEKPNKHPGAWTLWWFGPRIQDWTWMRFDQIARMIGIKSEDE